MSKQVELETNDGTIRIELDDEKAPESVKNFLDLRRATATTTAPCSTASSRAS